MAQQRQEKARLSAEAERLAHREIEGTERVREAPGDLTILAEEVSGAWSLPGKKPKMSTIRAYLKDAAQHRRLPDGWA